MNAFVGKTWITLFLTWLFIFILMMCWYVKCQLKYFYFKGSSQKILSLPRFVNLLSIPANWKLLIFSRKKKTICYLYFLFFHRRNWMQKAITCKARSIQTSDKIVIYLLHCKIQLSIIKQPLHFKHFWK